MSDNIKPDAWMVTGGCSMRSVYRSVVYDAEVSAISAAVGRGDGSRAVPLYADWRPQAIAWLRAESDRMYDDYMEESCGVRMAADTLEAELRQSKDKP